jgi:hypothetical protein
VRAGKSGKTELYHLGEDLQESRDVAVRRPALAAEMEALLATARTESVHWPVR